MKILAVIVSIVATIATTTNAAACYDDDVFEGLTSLLSPWGAAVSMGVYIKYTPTLTSTGELGLDGTACYKHIERMLNAFNTPPEFSHKRDVVVPQNVNIIEFIDPSVPASQESSKPSVMPGSLDNTKTDPVKQANLIGQKTSIPIIMPDATQDMAMRGMMPQDAMHNMAVQGMMPQDTMQNMAVQGLMPQDTMQNMAVQGMMPQDTMQNMAVQGLMPQDTMQNMAVQGMMPEDTIQNTAVHGMMSEGTIKDKTIKPSVQGSAVPVMQSRPPMQDAAVLISHSKLDTQETAAPIKTVQPIGNAPANVRPPMQGIGQNKPHQNQLFTKADQKVVHTGIGVKIGGGVQPGDGVAHVAAGMPVQISQPIGQIGAFKESFVVDQSNLTPPKLSEPIVKPVQINAIPPTKPVANDRLVNNIMNQGDAAPIGDKPSTPSQQKKCDFNIPSFLLPDMSISQREFEQRYMLPALRAHLLAKDCRSRALTIYIDFLLYLRLRNFNV